MTKPMIGPGAPDAALMALAQAIAAGDSAAVLRTLNASPELARAALKEGASRRAPKPFYLDAIGYYAYAGTTALHVAAAGYRENIVRQLIALGADVRAKNRRGAEPLHAAAVGAPGSRAWNPDAQVATIACLIEAGADPNAVDISGVTPLHRAVRTRCGAAAKALLDRGADAGRKTDGGSSALRLATLNTGRGGSGSPAAKAEQQEILRLLTQHGGVRP